MSGAPAATPERRQVRAVALRCTLFVLVTVLGAFPGRARAVRDDLYDALIEEAIAEAGGRHPPPVALVKAIIRQESAFRPGAISRAGARGLMQVMPATAARIGIPPTDLFDPRQNIRAGVRLLAILLERYRGDVISTLVAYNARPRAIFARIPRNGETPAYVWRVLAYYEWYSGPRAARDSRPGERFRP